MPMTLNATSLRSLSKDGTTLSPWQSGNPGSTEAGSFASMLRQTQALAPSADAPVPVAAPAPVPPSQAAPASESAHPPSPSPTPVDTRAGGSANGPTDPKAPAAAQASDGATPAHAGNDGAGNDAPSAADASQANGTGELDRALLARKLRAADDAAVGRRNTAHASSPGDDTTDAAAASGKTTPATTP